MEVPLHVLHLEDDQKDAECILSTLRAEGIACTATRVETRDDFNSAIERGGFDIILADFAVPDLDGLSALEIARKRCPDIPFILVSGKMGEEVAVESLKSGATDYILKDGLSRLAPAVHRAMQEVEARAERKRLEEQFIQAQKMEVVGKLASGVAHDFNNMLAVILGHCDMMLEQLPPNGPMHKHAEQVREAASRSASLTRQLLAFSRKQVIEPTVLDLSQVIADMEKMLRRLIGEDIELIVRPAASLGRVQADLGNIEQVVMNLVVNARDAMPNGGTVTIETTNVAVDADHAQEMDAPPGDYVMLTVADTGAGMSEEVKKHLFEAFFTTKPAGKGTGLGLSTCHNIVKQCGGHIAVHSTLGKGATFEIYLPRIPAKRVPITAAVAEPTAVPRGIETILLVEDEPAVRNIAALVLSSQGYTVLQASNGQDALRVVQERGDMPLDLVVTDVIMPQMGGKVMAEWLSTTNPDLKILFTSGYTEDAMAERPGAHESSFAFLVKPYAPAALARKVRETLDGGRAHHPAVAKAVTPGMIDH